MSDSDIEVVDLTCRGCGQTMKLKDRPNVKVTKLENGGLMFTSNDDPFMIECEYCGKSFMTWKPGNETNRANGWSGSGFNGAIAQGNGAVAIGAGGIYIKGGITAGSNIIIGNQNKIIRNG